MQKEKGFNEITERLVFSWDYFYQYRKMVKNQFPDFWKLRVIKKPLEILKEEIQPQDKILDIGAGNREIGEKLIRTLNIKSYKSMDIDQNRFHDYYSLDEIDENFNAVFLFEVIEHLNLREGINLIKRIHSLLLPKGKLFLTTPNLYHPHRYWDCQHKTPYRYDELGGFLLALGFSIENIYRIYNDAFFRRIFRLYFAAYLHRYLGIDFALSIFIVAKRDFN